MQTSYYHEFLVLARTQNFWEASECLYISQSTLSKHIQMMETELGAPLFVRTTRHVTLTEYGRTFLPYAQEISQKIEESTEAIRRMTSKAQNVITLGTVPDMDSYGITNIIHQYKQEYPDHSFQIMEDDPVNLSRLLLENKCDAVFTRETKSDFENHFMEDKNIVRIPYIKERMVAVVPRRHRLAQAPSLTLNQLAGEKFCLLSEGTMMYDFAVAACRSAGFLPNVVFTSHRLGNIFDMVSRGHCVALLMNVHTLVPVDEGQPAPKLGFRSVELVPEITAQVSLCHLANRQLSGAARTFLRYCNETFLKKTSLPPGI